MTNERGFSILNANWNPKSKLSAKKFDRKLQMKIMKTLRADFALDTPNPARFSTLYKIFQLFSIINKRLVGYDPANIVFEPLSTNKISQTFKISIKSLK